MTWVLLVGAAAVGWMIWTFNRLTRLRQLGDNAWADIDVQLKRRHDLIPSVVAVVKGHAGYERETLEALVAARGRAGAGGARRRPRPRRRAALLRRRTFRSHDPRAFRFQARRHRGDQRAVYRLLEWDLPHDPSGVPHAAGSELDAGTRARGRA